MSDPIILILVWAAFAIHVVAGLAVLRQWADLPLLPLLNAAIALCVLAYWVKRWYGFIAHGIQWYATDQLIPLYAIGICVLSALSLTHRYTGSWPHWSVFGLHTALFLAAALFFTFFRMNRMI